MCVQKKTFIIIKIYSILYHQEFVNFKLWSLVIVPLHHVGMALLLCQIKCWGAFEPDDDTK